MKNVALFGKFASGKTTVAHVLADDYGYTRVSMAANMKQIVLDVYGTLDKSATVEVTRQDGEVVTKTIREVLQGLGEAVKVVDRDLWLKWMIADSEYMASQLLVMDDARLQFEADALRKLDWLLVKLVCPEEERIRRYFSSYGRLPSDSEMHHRTETELDDIECDLVLDSTDSPEHLADAILAFMGEDMINMVSHG